MSRFSDRELRKALASAKATRTRAYRAWQATNYPVESHKAARIHRAACDLVDALTDYLEASRRLPERADPRKLASGDDQ